MRSRGHGDDDGELDHTAEYSPWVDDAGMVGDTEGKVDRLGGVGGGEVYAEMERGREGRGRERGSCGKKCVCVCVCACKRTCSY